LSDLELWCVRKLLFWLATVGENYCQLPFLPIDAVLSTPENANSSCVESTALGLSVLCKCKIQAEFSNIWWIILLFCEPMKHIPISKLKCKSDTIGVPYVLYVWKLPLLVSLIILEAPSCCCKTTVIGGIESGYSGILSLIYYCTIIWEELKFSCGRVADYNHWLRT
jgi:hypothetical protein